MTFYIRWSNGWTEIHAESWEEAISWALGYGKLLEVKVVS